MILADKITNERKKLGLSQEELADRLSVSRQAVSKWESAQSVPDLQNILAMSELFSVSTDYLLKDDAEPETISTTDENITRPIRRVSMEEANAFLATMTDVSKIVALGVLLCILCPVMLIFLAVLAAAGLYGLTESAAVAVGLIFLFGMIAAALFLFIRSVSKTEPFAYLEKESFETAYGVSGLAKEKKAAYEPTFTRFLSLGIVLCVLSPLPLIIAALTNGSPTLITSMTALLLCIVAAGVYMIVRVAIRKSSFEILLQERDHSKTEKKKKAAAEAFDSIYWCLVTAGYLAWSFLSGQWSVTWIVWPVAGILFAPFDLIVKSFCNTKDEA